MAEPPPLPARFTPLLRSSQRRRRVLFIVGPLLWVAALLALAVLLRRGDSVQYAVLVLVISFLIALPALLLSRVARVRAERRA